MADEESLLLGESLQTIATLSEQVAFALREPPGDRTAVARSLMGLLDLLREYRHLVQDMGEDWHVSIEFKEHMRALTQFRGLVTRWAGEAGPPHFQTPDAADFELSAWRLLGAGALLLDAFDQPTEGAWTSETETVHAHVEPSWWGRLMTVLHLKP